MTTRGALYASAGVVALYWVAFAARHLLRPHPMPESVAVIALDVGIRFVIVVGLVFALMRAGGESIFDLGFARDGMGRFLLRSGGLAAAMFVLANVVLNSAFASLLGKGSTPPIAELFRDIREAPLWVFCAIVGGGIAEELARAFALTRFEKLWGRWGLTLAFVVDSIVFGLGHLYQGPGSAMTSGITGAWLALIFLQRRRVIDAMAVHALFDLMGIAAAYALYAS